MVSRKSQHTLTDYWTNHPTSLILAYIEMTMTRQSWLVCDSSDSFGDENKYLDNVLNKNYYNKDFIRHHFICDASFHYGDYTLHQRHFWNYCTDPTYSSATSMYLTNPPIHYFATTTGERKGQRRTQPQTGSSLQDRMLRLPGHL